MLDWLANSPDPNIIEEVCNIMKRCMGNSRPTSLVKLKGLIANTWSCIQVHELESLAASCPKELLQSSEQKVTFQKVTKY